MDGKITHVRPGWAVYEEAGHTAEGALTVTDDGVKFDGHFVCGPHDALGNHVEQRATLS